MDTIFEACVTELENRGQLIKRAQLDELRAECEQLELTINSPDFEGGDGCGQPHEEEQLRRWKDLLQQLDRHDCCMSVVNKVCQMFLDNFSKGLFQESSEINEIMLHNILTAAIGDTYLQLQ